MPQVLEEGELEVDDIFDEDEKGNERLYWLEGDNEDESDEAEDWVLVESEETDLINSSALTGANLTFGGDNGEIKSKS